VTDPKFALVARRSGASLPDVIAVWAYVLEAASANTNRGYVGDIDAEALDCMFGFPDTQTRTADILKAMRERNLIDADGFVVAWEKRQPKRERDGDSSTDRVRAHRAKERHETPRNANGDQETPDSAAQRPETPRGEERREDISQASPAHPHRRAAGGRFAEFWTAWPKGERKQDKAKCHEHWKRNELDQQADAILGDVRTKRGTVKWQEGFIETPLVYLRGKRWLDGVEPDTGIEAGAAAVRASQDYLAADRAHREAAQTPEAKAAAARVKELINGGVLRTGATQ
jgi:hypothetical protein